MKQFFQDLKKFIHPYLMKVLFYILFIKEKVETFIKKNKFDLLYWGIVLGVTSILLGILILMPGFGRTLISGTLAFISCYIRFSGTLKLEQKDLNTMSNSIMVCAIALMLSGLFN